MTQRQFEEIAKSSSVSKEDLDFLRNSVDRLDLGQLKEDDLFWIACALRTCANFIDSSAAVDAQKIYECGIRRFPDSVRMRRELASLLSTVESTNRLECLFLLCTAALLGDQESVVLLAQELCGIGQKSLAIKILVAQMQDEDAYPLVAELLSGIWDPI